MKAMPFFRAAAFESRRTTSTFASFEEHNSVRLVTALLSHLPLDAVTHLRRHIRDAQAHLAAADNAHALDAMAVGLCRRREQSRP